MRGLAIAVSLLLLLTIVPGTASATPLCPGEPASNSEPVAVYPRGGIIYVFIGETTHNGYWWGTQYPLAC